MKNIVLLFAFFAFSVSTFAQSASTIQVPDQAKQYISTHVTAAKNISWKTSEQNLVASYSLNDNEASSVFNADGQWLENHSIVSKSEMPQGAQDYMDNVKDYFTITKIYRDENVTSTQYKVLSSREGHTYSFTFGADGKIITRQIEN